MPDSIDERTKKREQLKEDHNKAEENNRADEIEDDTATTDIMIAVMIAANNLKNIGERSVITNGTCVLTQDDIESLKLGMIALQVVDPHLLFGGDE